MPYSPPSGWVETRPPELDPEARIFARFHTRMDCARIAGLSELRNVDKPYSATRCTLCASEVHESAPELDVGQLLGS